MGRTVIHLAASMLMLLQGVMPAFAFGSNLNRMSASPGMAYANDILGNRLTRNISSSNSSAQRLEWDWSNRVKDACGVSGGARFEYRADGMRTLKIEGLTIAWSYYEEDDKHEKGSGFYDDVWSWNQPTTRYYYDGQMGFEDDYAYQTGSYGSSTSHLDVTRYGLGARGIDRIAKTTSVGEGSEAMVIQYPLYDAHGNMVATLSKGSGTAYTVSNQRAFEPWGSVFDSSGLSNTPKQGYCASIGHVADSENGLTYMRARYYEPTTGRFISEDRKRHGPNWFTYCANRPPDKIDKSGQEYLAEIEALFQSFLTELRLWGSAIETFVPRGLQYIESMVILQGMAAQEAQRWFTAASGTVGEAGDLMRAKAATCLGESTAAIIYTFEMILMLGMRIEEVWM